MFQALDTLIAWAMLFSMRQSRIKAVKGEDALYHAIDRIVGGDFLMGPVEKEVFLKIMWRVARFLGLKIYDYCVMDTHAHKLIFCPGKVELTDEQFLERLREYKGERHPEVRTFANSMKSGGMKHEELRTKYRRRMGNISEFEKSHKQMFTTWYNRRHKRRGTLWMERFSSVLVENVKAAREAVAVYLDLNPVRAEIVSDPKDYRFCAYAAALGGDQRCREGLMAVMEKQEWEKAAAAYRLELMQVGQIRRQGKRGCISQDLFLQTRNDKGVLPAATLFRLRIRYFTEGLVLGTEAFVQKAFDRHRSHFGKKRQWAAFPLEGFEDSPLRVLRKSRNNPIG